MTTPAVTASNASILAAATTASTSAGATSSSSSSSSSDAVGSQNYFLQLLIAQMNNQDPLNPMDSAQVTSQLAQINTVQGIDQLSTQLSSLLTAVSATQSTQDAALIGQQVMVPGTSLTLGSSGAKSAFTLPQSTSVTNVLIKNSSGATVKTIQMGAQGAGTIAFTWDGSTDSGAAASPGNYSYSVAATAGTAAVAATTLSSGIVTAVVPGSNGASPSFTVGSLGTFTQSQISQIQ